MQLAAVIEHLKKYNFHLYFYRFAWFEQTTKFSSRRGIHIDFFKKSSLAVYHL